MAAPTNTATTLVSAGNREDLEDVIWRVAPEETPFSANIGKAKATGIYHEWQTESLASPDATNAQLEGDDIASLDAPNLTSRLGNYNQIFRKTAGVSRTQEIVDKAGRESELDRQKVLKGIELRRDAEKRFIGNFASNAESGSTPRRTGGLLAFLTSNASRGAGGSGGGFSGGVVAAATNGTQRTFTEALVKGVLATCFNNGGRPTQAYMGSTHKQAFSAFTGIAEIRRDAPGQAMATIIGAADIYVSDFGNLALIPHAYGLTRDCVLVDPDMAAIATLDGIKTTPLGKSGDADKVMITMEKCLVVKNEKAHGVIADLT
ncbi:MAG TPA: DUF5309 domain-containing protein [Caulobacteraceae bacterium]|nr:DUF5309 domain-containing protein [Caulobacteraceae bacterium]